jgi:16S rRNA (guanine966-N2)-methyltransferase
MFDVLGSLMDIDGAVVADLFAGSGALGIEALSRGAESVVFVDRDLSAVGAIRRNLAATGLEGPPATLVRAEVVEWLAGVQERERPGDRGRRRRFDLALVDPPYSFTSWSALLAVLDAEVSVLETNRALVVPETFETIKFKRYGDTLVTVLEARGLGSG